MEKPELEHNDAKVTSLEPADSEEGIEWTEEEERRVRRKLDYFLIPTVTIMYTFCFLDRTNIGNARIQGMQKDLDLHGLRFNWALTAFYLVYAAVEVPSNALLKKVGPRRYLPALTVCFGIVCMSTAFAKNFAQLMVLRVLLGVTEGGMMPGTTFYLSSFYKRQELLFRVGIFATSASLAGAFGGLLATGLTKIPEWGAGGSRLHTWRNIFFFEGIITIVIGFVSPIFLAQHPHNCHFLNERERVIAHERIAREHKGDTHEPVTMKSVYRAFFNINNIICALGFLAVNVGVQSISVFMPTILRDMGYQAIQAQLRSVPPYACASVFAIIVAFASDKTRLRGIWIIIFSLIAVAGYAVERAATAETKNSIKYGAVFIIAVGMFPNGPGFLTWALNNAAGPAVRAVTAAMVMTIGTMGGVISTWVYTDADKPLYRKGHSINLSFQVLAVALAAVCVVYCRWENKKRDRGERDSRLHGLSDAEIIKLGYRNPKFRYWL